MLWKYRRPRKNYRVKSGDSLLSIALKFKLSLTHLKKLNDIPDDDDFIAVGDMLSI